MKEIQIQDQKFVFAGSFGNKKQILIEGIQKNKGIIEEELDETTNYLVVGRKPGAKQEKAESLGIQILLLEDLERFLEDLHFRNAHAPEVIENIPSFASGEFPDVYLYKRTVDQIFHQELLIQKGFFPAPLKSGIEWRRGENCLFRIDSGKLIVTDLQFKQLFEFYLTSDITEISNVFRWDQHFCIISSKKIYCFHQQKGLICEVSFEQLSPSVDYKTIVAYYPTEFSIVISGKIQEKYQVLVFSLQDQQWQSMFQADNEIFIHPIPETNHFFIEINELVHFTTQELMTLNSFHAEDFHVVRNPDFSDKVCIVGRNFPDVFKNPNQELNIRVFFLESGIRFDMRVSKFELMDSNLVRILHFDFSSFSGYALFQDHFNIQSIRSFVIHSSNFFDDPNSGLIYHQFVWKRTYFLPEHLFAEPISYWQQKKFLVGENPVLELDLADELYSVIWKSKKTENKNLYLDYVSHLIQKQENRPFAFGSLNGNVEMILAIEHNYEHAQYMLEKFRNDLLESGWNLKNPDQKERDSLSVALDLVPVKYRKQARELVRSAVYLKFAEDVNDSSLGESKLNGIPDVPEGFVWPKSGRKAMFFLCQIRLEELPAFQERSILPEKGMLYFFVDQFQNPGIKAKVIYSSDVSALKPAKVSKSLQKEMDYHSMTNIPFGFTVQWMLPGVIAENRWELGTFRNKIEDKRLEELYKQHWKPDYEAHEMPLSWLLGYAEDGLADWKQRFADAEFAESDTWVPLLRLSSDLYWWFDLALPWSIVFWIPLTDLKRHCFDHVRAVLTDSPIR